MSNIFTLKKDIPKMHCNNVRFNITDNAPLVVYQIALVKHWLVMGLKIDSSHVDTRLSKMEVAIENIVFFMAVGNLAINQFMECEITMAITAKATSGKEPKWTTVMKNMHQVVSQAMETLANASK
jgi:hypothetical protein